MLALGRFAGAAVRVGALLSIASGFLLGAPAQAAPDPNKDFPT